MLILLLDGFATAKKALQNCNAGADIIVVGNAIAKNSGLIKEMCEAVHG